MGHAEALQRDDVARLGARLDLEVLHPVKGVELDGRAQGGCGHRELNRAVQVIAAALVGLVRDDVDLDIQVTRWACSRTDLATARELDPGPGVHPGRNANGEVAAVAHPTLAGTLEAGVRDDDAEALAGTARSGGHDLAEERPLDLPDLTSTGADVTGARAGARLRSVAVAGAAGDRRIDGQLTFDPEDGLRHVDVEPDQGVLAPALARPWPSPCAAGRLAEEGIHDVTEGEALAKAGARATVGVRAGVVGPSLVRVGQHVIGLGNPLELALRLVVSVDVRVQLAGHPVIRPLDVLGLGVAADAEVLVVVVQ